MAIGRNFLSILEGSYENILKGADNDEDRWISFMQTSKHALSSIYDGGDHNSLFRLRQRYFQIAMLMH